MVAKGGLEIPDHLNLNIVTKHNIYLEKNATMTDLIGLGWESLVEAYDLEEDDIVRFTFDPQHDHFNVTIISDIGENKLWVHFPGM
jgi:hypothetical protein